MAGLVLRDIVKSCRRPHPPGCIHLPSSINSSRPREHRLTGRKQLQRAPDFAYFATIPWAAVLLRYSKLKAISPVHDFGIPFSENSLFGRTLRKARSIKRFLILRRPLAQGQKGALIDRVYALLSLGYGMADSPNICHRGILVTIMDEVIANLIDLNLQQEDSKMPRLLYTPIHLDTTFLKPVATPCDILVTARLTLMEEQSLTVVSTVQSGKGTIFARAESRLVGVEAGVEAEVEAEIEAEAEAEAETIDDELNVSGDVQPAINRSRSTHKRKRMKAAGASKPISSKEFHGLLLGDH